LRLVEVFPLQLELLPLGMEVTSLSHRVPQLLILEMAVMSQLQRQLVALTVLVDLF
jgi:hypothetical protein